MHPTSTQRPLPALLGGLIAVLAGLATGAAHAAFPSSVALSTLDGSTGARIDGVQAGDFLGYSFARAGDINNDGLADFVVGAPSGGTFPGAAYVVYGKPQGLPHPLDPAALTGASDGFRIDGSAENGQLGAAAGTAGDLNGDGIADLVVGAPGESAAYVIFGRNGSDFADSFSVSGLDGSNGFRIGGVANGQSGYSVAGAGDVNGDGVDDLVLGNGAPNMGVAYVLFGTAGGFPPHVDATSLDGANGFAIVGAGTNQGYFKVGGAGDVNGDGIADLIVGSPNAAAAYVIFGRGSFGATVGVNTLNGSNGFQLNGPAGSFFGNGVAGAGDVNGDGVADVAAGAPMASTDSTNNQAGKTYVVFGKAGGFTSPLSVASLNGSNGGFQIYGAAPGDRSGWSVGSGDINGDGTADLAIGAPYSRYAGTAAGASYVVFGHAGAFPSPINLSGNPVMPNHLDGTNGFQLVGVTGDMSGWTVGGGDVNGDGADDLLIGARLATVAGLTNAGRGYVFYGQSSADTTPPVVKVTGVTSGATYRRGKVPQAGCSTTDDQSGVAVYASLTLTGGNSKGTGTFTATCSGAVDFAGNAAAPVSVTYTVK